jgi:hypothetical protein
VGPAGSAATTTGLELGDGCPAAVEAGADVAGRGVDGASVRAGADRCVVPTLAAGDGAAAGGGGIGRTAAPVAGAGGRVAGRLTDGAADDGRPGDGEAVRGGGSAPAQIAA